MKFYKYESCGNDFIIIDNEKIELDEKTIIRLTNRNYGIGGDGIIHIKEKEIRIYNKDGSTAKMCGNGLKCLIKYYYDQNIVFEKLLNHNYEIINNNNSNSDFKIKIYFREPKEIKYNTINFPSDEEIVYFKTNTGVEHLVLFKDFNLEEAEILRKKENANINYVKIINKGNIKVITYEKGVGLTKACGTGAIASFYISNQLGYCSEQVRIDFENDFIELKKDKRNIIMYGNANYVFKGEI